MTNEHNQRRAEINGRSWALSLGPTGLPSTLLLWQPNEWRWATVWRMQHLRREEPKGRVAHALREMGFEWRDRSWHEVERAA